MNKQNIFYSNKNFYEILQVDRNADPIVIKKAYSTLMKDLKNHPDLGGSQDNAKIINEAYETLMDKEKRETYNIKLSHADKNKKFKKVEWVNNKKEKKQISVLKVIYILLFFWIFTFIVDLPFFAKYKNKVILKFYTVKAHTSYYYYIFFKKEFELKKKITLKDNNTYIGDLVLDSNKFVVLKYYINDKKNIKKIFKNNIKSIDDERVDVTEIKAKEIKEKILRNAENKKIKKKTDTKKNIFDEPIPVKINEVLNKSLSEIPNRVINDYLEKNQLNKK